MHWNKDLGKGLTCQRWEWGGGKWGGQDHFGRSCGGVVENEASSKAVICHL